MQQKKRKKKPKRKKGEDDDDDDEDEDDEEGNIDSTPIVAPPPIKGFEMEDEHYTDDDHIEQLLFHRENDYDNIVNMDVEGRYERLKVILEDTEKARGISKETRASFKEYADEYKKLRECQYMCHSIQYKEGIFLDPHTNMALPDQKDDDGHQ